MQTVQTALITEPSRAEIEVLEGATILEFGAAWCSHCKAAQPIIHEALGGDASIRHLRIEDGKGKPLGRSYRVTRWPTLVFLMHGQEITRLVRPADAAAIRAALHLVHLPG